MWKAQFHQIDQQTTKTALIDGSRDLSFRGVIALWCDSAEFREYFTTLLSESSFDAFFWETPPVTERTLNRSFEFVLVQGVKLSRLRPDRSPFLSQFSARPSEEVL